jgi:hypothetical protein
VRKTRKNLQAIMVMLFTEVRLHPVSFT